MKYIVTGGCGYIGVHTIVELMARGCDAISIDNNSRSSETILDGVQKLTGKKVRNYQVDLRDHATTERVFAENADSLAVIHFAAFKTVPESVAQPLLYYDNNIASLLNVLEFTGKYRIPHFVFSSSCSVYGNARELPVTEETPFGEAECPYARTKQMGEQIVRDFARVSHAGFVSLRYFNPVGAHPSAEIGEAPYGRPENLVPAITQTAIGKLPELVVYGDDYDTRDGTCIRDYIHVSDIARAHVKAVEYMERRRPGVRDQGSHRNLELSTRNSQLGTLNYDAFNLGSGHGTTVLEAIKAFETVSGRKLNYRIGPRRPGDVAAVYSDNRKASEILDWRPEYDLAEMMRTAWRWQQKLSE